MARTAFQALFDRLKAKGFNRRFVERFRPDWWDADDAESPAALDELKVHLAQSLGLDINSVLDDSADILLRTETPAEFRATRATATDKIALTQALATAIAEAADAAIDVAHTPLPGTAMAVRNEILRDGKPWVGFRDLAGYLWDHGIPVLPLAQKPQGAANPDGLVLRIRDRPVICLPRAEKLPAWMLYVLAHETGHIIAGHLAQSENLIDEKIEPATTGMRPQEREANALADTLLCGENQKDNLVLPRTLKARAIGEMAQEQGRTLQIDPGHIALRHGWFWQRFAASREAAKRLAEDATPLEILASLISGYLDLDQLPEDRRTAFKVLTSDE